MPRALLVFEPPDGGVAVNVGQLATGLTAHGWETAVAGPLDALPYADLERAGVPVHRLGALRRGYGRPGQDAAALRALVDVIGGGGFDLVHCHASKAGVLGRLAARAAGVPTLYSPHCFAFDANVGAAWSVASTVIEGTLGHLGGTILCVCEHERELALRKRIAPASRLRVVHNGCAPCAGDVAPDPALARLRSGGTLVGAVAVLREQKGLDVLIAAAPLVFARAPETRIAIVGDGPLHDQLADQAARLGLDADDRFALLPYSPPAERQLAALDVYVLPSLWEAFPIGVLEALACGVPQVATDVGGTGEAVSADTGLLVAPRDPVALADAIVALVADPARRARMADASRELHARRFGLETMVAATAAVYDDVSAGAAVRRHA